MKVAKQKVRNLRKQGNTFREISKITHTPLSTVYLWTKHINLTKQQQDQIDRKHHQAFAEGRKKALQKQRQKRQKEMIQNLRKGESLIGKVNHRELLLIGAALYWCEGFKRDTRLGFANSDPKMIQLFLKWLVEIGQVNPKDIRLRVGANISYKNSIEAIQQKWAQVTGIPINQFQKPFFQKVQWKGKYANRGEYLGVLRIRANNQRKLFLMIKGMLNGLKK